MADLDLRTLSAPIEALRPKVEAAYRLLDEQWKSNYCTAFRNAYSLFRLVHVSSV